MENHTIANLACSLLKYFGAEGTGNATLPEADALLQKKYKNVVVLLLDGMGVEILRKHLEPEGWFRRHLAAEYHSVFPPTTVAATTSIDSGLFPNQHGWLGWTCYYKEIDKNVTVFLNTDEEDLPAADFPVASTYYPYVKVTDRIREAGKEAYVVSPFGELAVSSFAELCEEVGRLCETGGEKYIYAYWMEPDGLMHKAGVDVPEVTQLLQELEKQVVKLAAGLEDTLLLVTADHGHINARGVSLTEYPHIMECFRRMPSIEPRALNLYVKDDMHTQFVKAFNEAFGDTFRLYTKEEVLEKQIFGTGEDHARFADLLGDYLAVAVSDLAIYNTVEEKEAFIGVHAGMTEEELRIPLIAFGKEKR